jgi:hypothetical protein
MSPIADVIGIQRRLRDFLDDHEVTTLAVVYYGEEIKSRRICAGTTRHTVHSPPVYFSGLFAKNKIGILHALKRHLILSIYEENSFPTDPS